MKAEVTVLKKITKLWMLLLNMFYIQEDFEAH